MKLNFYRYLYFPFSIAIFVSFYQIGCIPFFRLILGPAGQKSPFYVKLFIKSSFMALAVIIVIGEYL